MADVEEGRGGVRAVAAPATGSAAPADTAPFVSGSISLPSADENTLDEPVSATIVRAFRRHNKLSKTKKMHAWY